MNRMANNGLIIMSEHLVDRGDTVIVIEHNLDMIAATDCVIDLGPEGGDQGGRVVAWGSPEEVAHASGSCTAEYLRGVLERVRSGSSKHETSIQHASPG